MPDGYLRGILAEADRPVRHRAGVRDLLGVPADAGVRVIFPAVVRGGFVYRHQTGGGSVAPSTPGLSMPVAPSWQVEIDDPSDPWSERPQTLSGTGTATPVAAPAPPGAPRDAAPLDVPPSEPAEPVRAAVVSVPGITARPASPSTVENATPAGPDGFATRGTEAPRASTGAGTPGVDGIGRPQHAAAVAPPDVPSPGPVGGPSTATASAATGSRTDPDVHHLVDRPALPSRPGAPAQPSRPRAAAQPSRPGLPEPEPDAWTRPVPPHRPPTDPPGGATPAAEPQRRRSVPVRSLPSAEPATDVVAWQPDPRRAAARPAPAEAPPRPDFAAVPPAEPEPRPAPAPPPAPSVVVIAPPESVGPAAFWQRRHVGRLRARNLR
jgi:hypothetical protein